MNGKIIVVISISASFIWHTNASDWYDAWIVWCVRGKARQASERTNGTRISTKIPLQYFIKLAQYMCNFKFEYHLGIWMHIAAVAAATVVAQWHLETLILLIFIAIQLAKLKPKMFTYEMLWFYHNILNRCLLLAMYPNNGEQSKSSSMEINEMEQYERIHVCVCLWHLCDTNRKLNRSIASHRHIVRHCANRNRYRLCAHKFV